MKSKGFTLIELLAVIVILAIIAIIATPIVLNIINDASESAAKESANAYIKAVEQGYVSKLTKKEKIENGEYTIPALDELGIKVKGDKPSGAADYVTLQNGKVTDYSLTIKGYHIYYSEGDMIVDSGKDDDAKDKITPLDHTVTFMVDGEPYEIVSIRDGGLVSAPIIEPTSISGTFTGWLVDGKKVEFPYPLESDVVISARFQTVRTDIELHNAGDLVCAFGENKLLKNNDGLAIVGYTSFYNGSGYYAYFIVLSLTEQGCLYGGYTQYSDTIEYDGKTYYYKLLTNSSSSITDWGIGYNTGLKTSDTKTIAKAILDYYFMKI